MLSQDHTTDLMDTARVADLYYRPPSEDGPYASSQTILEIVKSTDPAAVMEVGATGVQMRTWNGISLKEGAIL